MSHGDEAENPTDEAPEIQASDSKPEHTVEGALTWIAAVSSASLLSLLRHKDNAAIANRAFAGFRANQQGLAIPTVKQRIAQEAVKNPPFGDKLLALYESVATSTRKTADPASQASLQKEQDAARARKQEQKRAAELKALETLTEQRDRLKRELIEQTAKVSEQEAAVRSISLDRQKTEDENGRLRHQQDAQAVRIERLERQTRRHEKEMSDLVKEIRSLHKDAAANASKRTRLSSDVSSSAPNTINDIHSNIWTESLRRHLELNHVDAVTPIVGEALRLAPDDIDVLEMAADLARRRNDPRTEVEHLKVLLSSLLQSGRGADALSIWARLALLHPSYPESKRLLQQIIGFLPNKRGPEFDEANRVIARLRTTSQELHNRVLSAMASRDALARLFLPTEAEEHGMDRTFMTLGSRRITFGNVVDAIDLGDRELVAKIAAGINEIKKSDQSRIEALLNEISSLTGDHSYLVPLAGGKSPSRPAVVDSSNIAWIGQEDLARGRPRLKSVLEVRKALRQKGYFPILLYADANLPYAIDDKDSFHHMVNRGEVRLVDAGVVADEEILRNAKRFGAVIVTNDYMEDWDPQNQVKKIGIALSHTGQVSFID